MIFKHIISRFYKTSKNTGLFPLVSYQLEYFIRTYQCYHLQKKIFHSLSLNSLLIQIGSKKNYQYFQVKFLGNFVSIQLRIEHEKIETSILKIF